MTLHANHVTRLFLTDEPLVHGSQDCRPIREQQMAYSDGRVTCTKCGVSVPGELREMVGPGPQYDWRPEEEAR